MTILAARNGRWAMIICVLLLAAGVAVLWWPDQDRAAPAERRDESVPVPPPQPAGAVPAPPVGERSIAVATGLTLSLERVGDIPLSDGEVERVYRVRVANDQAWRPRVTADLVSAGAGVTIIEGRAELGDLAPGARVLSADTVTLRHDPDLDLPAAALQWEFSEIVGSAVGGTLLSGAGDELAIHAVHDYDSSLVHTSPGAATQFTSRVTPAPRVSGVIGRGATVEQVNAVLRETGALIVQMRPGSPTVVLQLARPGGIDVAERAADRLLASGAFEWARPVTGDLSQAEPGEIPPPDPEPEFDDHRPR